MPKVASLQGRRPLDKFEQKNNKDGQRDGERIMYEKLN